MVFFIILFSALSRKSVEWGTILARKEEGGFQQKNCAFWYVNSR